MREALFIKKNAGKWKEYQHVATNDPDELAERFVTLVDDLSYAKTFYPRSKATRWINGITATIYQGIYRNKKEKYSRIFTFWKYELPLLFRKYHRVFLFTTLIFILFVAIGFMSAAYNPEFVKGVLGSDYVEMTEDNIRSGNPFGVYGNEDRFTMFIRIAFNNIRVAFATILGGFTLGLYTMNMMWGTGMMLGSFQQLFFANGLGVSSILTVWIHGTLEIASIVIAGTAGFILANGILFPGTYRRWDSFRRGAKDAVKIMVALIPFFIVAAFFEGYVTRLMGNTVAGKSGGLPAWGALLILAGSLALIIWYFVIYPMQLHRKGVLRKEGNIVERLKNVS
jgi:uncharacterized membrane protein SpoIIM required for sporulation